MLASYLLALSRLFIFALAVPGVKQSQTTTQETEISENDTTLRNLDNSPLITSTDSLAGAGELKSRSTTFKELATTAQDYAMYKRTLLAAVHYNCPISGRQMREFMWSAFWSREKNEVFVKALDNIDYWSPEVVFERYSHPPYFYSQWHHNGVCYRHGHYACKNTFNGWIEGWVIRGKELLMLMVKPEDDHVGLKQPYVLEACKYHHASEPYCLVPDGSLASYCKIEHVGVRLLPNDR
ncbi:protein of unknown function [Taphrina deformans PYCC 5710]|uniref:Uncharacterized protein n=1 Tax=Taphrina deformans (strain PYCC 5710 / ATCC 11124 / CBS 356.35 / IMI 108563 / JCM 9778 / NBRC 8474) TaxID=1097556 RepID=R4XL88_TAPDE|nr:protein of unknown function [Taphrina deformans PYCC 5710]|eukprot:CCG85150.1 protein of unknown function [Taphrina deformans PYCC 5710]